MRITDQEIETVKAIVLNGAKNHFPPPVKFHEIQATVRLDAQDREYLDVDLLYTSPDPVLDGHLMNSLSTAIAEPMQASGITIRTLVGYTDFNDPTRFGSPNSPTNRTRAS